jgi:hypothetical protein
MTLLAFSFAQRLVQFFQYNLVERTDDAWASQYFGGDDTVWFWYVHARPK